MQGEHASTASHLLVEERQLFVGGFVCFDQLDCNLIHAVHESLVDHSKTTFSQPALLVFRSAANADVLSAWHNMTLSDLSVTRCCMVSCLVCARADSCNTIGAELAYTSSHM